MAKLGNGSTITFGTSAFTAEIISIDGPDQSREAVESSHMATNNYHTFLPAGLVDGGSLEFEIAYDDSSGEPPITGATEVITVTYGNGSTLSAVFDGFVTGFNPSAAIDERMTATVSVKVADDIS